MTVKLKHPFIVSMDLLEIEDAVIVSAKLSLNENGVTFPTNHCDIYFDWNRAKTECEVRFDFEALEILSPTFENKNKNETS